MADVATSESKSRRRAPDSGSAEDVARGYFAAVRARDPVAMAGFWHAEGVDDIAALGVFRGPDAVRELFAELFAAVPDFEFVVERVTAGDRVAAVQWRAAGTFDGGPFNGIDPTGRRVELRGADCVEVEDGKIVRNTAYYDGAAFARGVGMLPAEDSGAERAMVAGFNALTRLRRTLKEMSR